MVDRKVEHQATGQGTEVLTRILIFMPLRVKTTTTANVRNIEIGVQLRVMTSSTTIKIITTIKLVILSVVLDLRRSCPRKIDR
jgi:hypothetical protein